MRVLCVVAACAGLFAVLPAAHDQEAWPSRPVRVVNSLVEQLLKQDMEAEGSASQALRDQLENEITRGGRESSARSPDVVIDVAFEDRRVDLIERGLELAVQVGELRGSGYITRRLSRGPRLTAASPAYFAQHACRCFPRG